jgi:molecular chaperone DnaK
MKQMKVVGIDLGTTFSAIAHLNDYGQVEIIPNQEGELITPSVIMFDDNVTVVGKLAQNHARAEPEKIVEFVKREMGKSKEEYSREFNGKEYSAEELSALILKKLKNDAEAYIKEEITDAVITVPAYFKDGERQATRLAGEIAGFNVLQVVNEPTAAALAFGIDLIGDDQTVFVFDLGGGTFDVTIMNVSGSELKMLATDGDHRLGGKDWDDRIIEYVAESFELEHGVDPLEDSHAYQNIQHSAIDAKKHLSKLDKCRISCSYDGNGHLIELTKEKFEELTADLVEKCKSFCDEVLTQAEMTWDDIDTVLLVGGSTRMPTVQDMVAEISGKEINPTEVNADEAVACGAAILGKDVPVPVPYGKDIVVIDGATHNLGLTPINDKGEQYIHVMIPKMTEIPCEVVDQFGTIEDNQTSVLIEVVQGLEEGLLKKDIPDFEENSKLGECYLDGLPPNQPKGYPISVTYKYNSDQILEVKAEAENGAVAGVEIDRKTLNEAEAKEATQHLQTLKVV